MVAPISVKTNNISSRVNLIKEMKAFEALTRKRKEKNEEDVHNALFTTTRVRPLWSLDEIGSPANLLRLTSRFCGKKKYLFLLKSWRFSVSSRFCRFWMYSSLRRDSSPAKYVIHSIKARMWPYWHNHRAKEKRITLFWKKNFYLRTSRLKWQKKNKNTATVRDSKS